MEPGPLAPMMKLLSPVLFQVPPVMLTVPVARALPRPIATQLPTLRVPPEKVKVPLEPTLGSPPVWPLATQNSLFTLIVPPVTVATPVAPLAPTIMCAVPDLLIVPPLMFRLPVQPRPLPISNQSSSPPAVPVLMVPLSMLSVPTLAAVPISIWLRTVRIPVVWTFTVPLLPVPAWPPM